MGIAGKTINDTEAVSVSTRGETARRLQGVRLSQDEASLLGMYASWCSRERLMPKLFCRHCGPDYEVEVNIDPSCIGIICGHRMLFHDGPVPVMQTDYPNAGVQATVTPVRVVIPDRTLSAADAFLLRRYEKFLTIYALSEAMWCGVCEDEGNPSGLRSLVTAHRISHLCRHVHRVYTGMTI